MTNIRTSILDLREKFVQEVEAMLPFDHYWAVFLEHEGMQWENDESYSAELRPFTSKVEALRHATEWQGEIMRKGESAWRHYPILLEGVLFRAGSSEWHEQNSLERLEGSTVIAVRKMRRKELIDALRPRDRWQ